MQISISNIIKGLRAKSYNAITKAFKQRVTEEGFTVEALNCVNEITSTFTLPDQRFIISVKTDNAGTSASNQFTIPTTGTGYNYDITTSDGQTILGNTGDTTITFPTAGEYDIFISGSFPQCYFNNGGDKDKLLDIKNFGIYALGSTSQENAFFGCSNMVISANDVGYFENVTSFSSAWRSCSLLTSFPLIDTSSGTSFVFAWRFCTSLTSFPLLDTSSGTSFLATWFGCSSLTSFPANAFDTNIATNYTDSFATTNLTTQSIDDILVSLDTSGVSNGTFDQSGGQGPSATGQNAITTLLGRGWTITTTAFVFDPDYQAVLDYATTQTYTLPSEPQRILQNDLIVSLKSAGVWNKLDSFAVQATNGDANFALIDWKRLITMTAVNAPTFTSNIGYQGNGTSAYIDTGFNPFVVGVNYTGLDASLGAYWDSGAVVTSDNLLASRTAFENQETALSPVKNSNNINSNSRNNRDSFSSIGDFMQIQLAGGNQYLFVDGVQTDLLPVIGVSSLANLNFFIFSLNNGGLPVNPYADATIRASYFGASILSESADFNTALTTYFNAI